MPGYNVFRKDRVKGTGGEGSLYVRNIFTCKEIALAANIMFECVGVEITFSEQMSLTMICFYRQPSAKVDFYEQFKILLNSCNPNKDLIFLSDTNINWDCKQSRKRLKQIMDSHNLVQLIDQLTRITKTSKTRTDLIFTNKSDRIAKTYNLLTGISDHTLILFTSKLTKKTVYRYNSAPPPSSILTTSQKTYNRALGMQ